MKLFSTFFFQQVLNVSALLFFVIHSESTVAKHKLIDFDCSYRLPDAIHSFAITDRHEADSIGSTINTDQSSSIYLLSIDSECSKTNLNTDKRKPPSSSAMLEYTGSSGNRWVNSVSIDESGSFFYDYFITPALIGHSSGQLDYAGEKIIAVPYTESNLGEVHSHFAYTSKANNQIRILQGSQEYNRLSDPEDQNGTSTLTTFPLNSPGEITALNWTYKSQYGLVVLAISEQDSSLHVQFHYKAHLESLSTTLIDGIPIDVSIVPTELNTQVLVLTKAPNQIILYDLSNDGFLTKINAYDLLSEHSAIETIRHTDETLVSAVSQDDDSFTIIKVDQENTFSLIDLFYANHPVAVKALKKNGVVYLYVANDVFIDRYSMAYTKPNPRSNKALIWGLISAALGTVAAETALMATCIHRYSGGKAHRMPLAWKISTVGVCAVVVNSGLLTRDEERKSLVNPSYDIELK